MRYLMFQVFTAFVYTINASLSLTTPGEADPECIAVQLYRVRVHTTATIVIGRSALRLVSFDVHHQSWR